MENPQLFVVVLGLGLSTLTSRNRFDILASVQVVKRRNWRGVKPFALIF